MATRQAKGCTSQNSLLRFKTRKWPPECPWSSKQCSGSIANSVCIEAPLQTLQTRHVSLKNHCESRLFSDGKKRAEKLSSSGGRFTRGGVFSKSSVLRPAEISRWRCHDRLHVSTPSAAGSLSDGKITCPDGFTLVSPSNVLSCCFFFFFVSSIWKFFPNFFHNFFLLIAIFYCWFTSVLFLLPQLHALFWSHLYVLNWHWYQWIPMIYTNEIEDSSHVRFWEPMEAAPCTSNKHKHARTLAGDLGAVQTGVNRKWRG